MWIADIASGKGKYIKDEGPTFNFHSVIFGDPDIHSTVINGLEFGCEIEKLSTTGKKTANIVHESFGMVDKIEYVDGVETARMYLRAGSPIRLEVLKEGTLYVAVNYVQYTSGMPFDSTLFERPNRIEYVGTAQK